MNKQFLLAILLAILFTPQKVFSQEDNKPTYDPEEWCTKTLPILYITTDSLKPIDTKEYYITGTYYLDALGLEGFTSIGSKDNQLPLEIKGRGNASWRLAKKPYKIKLGKKTALMGLPKSKHFALLAHFEDWRGYLKDEAAFEVSRRMKMAFTPRQCPIELVINGEFYGIYFVTQNVRVDPDRVNIQEQKDLDTIPENITGGWLIERDNYKDPNQFVIDPKTNLRITWHSPEILSTQQFNYIHDLFFKVDSLIKVEDKSSREWEKYIDIDTLARFYIINEVVENTEAFSGSLYMHKNRGADTKIIFGPVWDFGSSFSHPGGIHGKWLWEDAPNYTSNVWIQDLAKFPHFQQVIRKIWTKEHQNILNGFKETLFPWCDRLKPAGYADRQRWQDGGGHDIDYQSRKHVRWITERVTELNKIWNLEITNDVNNDGEVDITDVTTLINIILTGDTTIGTPADCNCDGTIDISDVTELIQYIICKEI